MTRRFDAVMFDLDGTLLDTLADIAAAGNYALTSLGRPTRPVQDYRYLAGQGAPYLVRHALGPDYQHLADKALELFRTYQLEHGLDHTHPYPGIPELLDELTRRNLKLAVLSNKPHTATLRAVQQCLNRWHFDAVLGHELDQPAAALKPDPAGALEIARQLNVPPERWLYLGDTRVDMETALNAGMFPVGCLWGFRDRQELEKAGARILIAHPLEILPLLAENPA